MLRKENDERSYIAKYPFVPEISLLLQKSRHFAFFKQQNTCNNGYNKLRESAIPFYYKSKESLFY